MSEGGTADRDFKRQGVVPCFWRGGGHLSVARRASGGSMVVAGYRGSGSGDLANAEASVPVYMLRSASSDGYTRLPSFQRAKKSSFLRCASGVSTCW